MTAPRIIVYTVITGGYDALAEIIPEPDIEYWLFTDDPSIRAPHFWNISLLVNPADLNLRRLSRLPKLRPHIFLPAHDISVYMDASLELRQPIREFAIACVREMPLAVHPHPGRKCLYVEAEKCLRVRLDDSEVINAQIERYRRDGFPANLGLTENRFIVRRKGEDIIRFNEYWYSEYLAGSQRDQLSFMYCVWRTGIPLCQIPQNARRNPYYKIHPHRRGRNDTQAQSIQHCDSQEEKPLT